MVEYAKLTYNSKKVQVDSAIRDGDGASISSNYLKSATAATTYLSQTSAASTYLSKTDAASTYATKSEIASVYRVKGTKATVGDLPSTGNVTGDVWNITDTGANYVWDGSAWDKLSETVDLSGYVPNTRTVNGHALSSDVTVTASDVGLGSVVNKGMDASPTSASDNYVKSGGVYTALAGKVSTSRTVNGKALSSDISLSASDVGALASGNYAGSASLGGPASQIASAAYSSQTSLKMAMLSGDNAVQGPGITVSSGYFTLGNTNIDGAAGAVAWANVTGNPFSATSVDLTES